MDDDNFDFDAAKSKSRNAKTGRRAQVALGEDSDAEEETLAPATNMANASQDGPPRPSRRVGGWGEDAPTRPARHRGSTDDLDDERLRPVSPEKEQEDSDNDIPVIPDLEDQAEEDMASQVAMAPNVAVNRVATYRELDNDLLRHAAFVTLDNEIDLKLLTKGLSGEQDLHEEDKYWEWERLFTEVTSELLTEWQAGDEITEDSADKPIGAI